MRYYDQKDAFCIGILNKDHNEVRRLLDENNFGHIPVHLFEFKSGKYVQTCPELSPGTVLRVRRSLALLSGAISTRATRYLLTVGHLFSGSGPGEACYYKDSNRCGDLKHLIDQINCLKFDKLTADLALVGSRCAETCVGNYSENKLAINDTVHETAKKYSLALRRADIIRESQVMIRDQDRRMQFGHISSSMFTDIEANLYNVMVVIDTNKKTPRAITRSGDSGALLLERQPLNSDYPDLKVYGLVTGVFSDGDGQTMTIVNRLGDVIDNCGVLEQSEIGVIDFESLESTPS